MTQPATRHDQLIKSQCQQCGTSWDEHFSLPMATTVFARRCKAVCCPSCGSRKVAVAPDPPEKAP